MFPKIKGGRVCQRAYFVAQPDSPVAPICRGEPFMDKGAYDPLYRRAGQFDLPSDLPKAESTGVCP